MKERPIIFSAESVRVILEGRKTQTRRVITADNSTVCGYSTSKHHSLWTGLGWDERVYKDRGPHILHPSPTEYLHVPWVHPQEGDDERVFRVRCKYDIGDRLWVRETLFRHPYLNEVGYKSTDEPVIDRRNMELTDGIVIWHWQKDTLPAPFMPR